MKKVIFSVILICMVGALVGIGTWAAFSDIETSPENVFEAGTLDLQVDGLDDPDVTAYFEVTCAAPGDMKEVEIVLSNVGCVDGLADIHIFVMEDDENVAWEPELAIGDVADVDEDIFDGELAEHLMLTIEVDLDGSSAIDNDGDGLIDEDPIDSVDNDLDGLVDEDPMDLDYDMLVVAGSLAPGEGKLGGPPIEDILLGVTGVNLWDYSEVFTVNAQTGAVTIVNGDSGNPLYSDIAVTPNGNVYAIGRNTTDTNFVDFYRLDPSDFSVVRTWESVFTNEGHCHVNALAAESHDSLLAIEGGGVCVGKPEPCNRPPRLLRIILNEVGNPTAIENLGAIGAGAAETLCSDGDLDMDPDTGKWYAGFWASAGSEMLELNLANPGNSQVVSQSNISYEAGLAFGIGDGDEDTVNAYAGSWADEKLYEVDIDGGGSTELHDLSEDLGGPIYGLTAPKRVPGIESIDHIIGSLPAYSSIYLKIGYLIPVWVGNIIQSDTLEFDIEFSLFQPLGPACLEVIDIEQPEEVQPNEQGITPKVVWKNMGQQTGECTFDAAVAHNGTPIAVCSVSGMSTGELAPMETVEIPICTFDAGDWAGETITVTVTPGVRCCNQDPVECEIYVPEPACIVVTGIQQPPEIFPCEHLIVAVDVHNAGEKPGDCSVEVWVEDDGGNPVVGPFFEDVPTLNPCETDKIPVVIGHVEGDWPTNIVVMAKSCCDIEPYPCPILIVEPPPFPPPECCWCIYDTQWWVCGTATSPDCAVPPSGPPDNREYFALHTVEWLPENHWEAVGAPFPGGGILVPPPSFHQELTAYAGPMPNGYGVAEWTPLNTVVPPGVCRYNNILTLVYATGQGLWNSQLDLINWKSRFDVNTPLGPIVLYSGTLGVVPMVGNAGWPYAVGNAWVSVTMSSITAPTAYYNVVVKQEIITVPAFPAGIMTFKVETSSWADANGVDEDGDGLFDEDSPLTAGYDDDADGLIDEDGGDMVPQPGELTISGTSWYNNFYGCAIKSDTYPGALYQGYETQDMMWYCQDPPFPPF